MEVESRNLPAKRTIIPYYAAAAFSFVLVNILTLCSVDKFSNHFFQPVLLAITHLTVLGWATMIIVGASNQLIPVITGKSLFSTVLPVICFTLLIPGICLIVHSFWQFHLSFAMYCGSFLVLLALILHSVNMFITSKAVSKNIAVDFILTAHVWLIATAALGIVLLFNLRFGFLPSDNLHYLRIHASAGIGGWFLLLVIGVSSRLLPMFLLSREEPKRYLSISWYLINSGLGLFFLEGLILNSALGKTFYTLLILTGVVFYLAYVRTCFKSALRKKLDGGMKQMLIAVGLMLIPSTLIMIANVFSKEAPSVILTSIAYSFFAGFISTLIMGQTFKTLPFIVWMHITGSGRHSDVQPKDLYNEQLVLLQMFFYTAGFLAFLCGMLLHISVLMYLGSSIMTLTALLYFGHVLYIIKQLRKA